MTQCKFKLSVQHSSLHKRGREMRKQSQSEWLLWSWALTLNTPAPFLHYQDCFRYITHMILRFFGFTSFAFDDCLQNIMYFYCSIPSQGCLCMKILGRCGLNMICVSCNSVTPSKVHISNQMQMQILMCSSQLHLL